MVARRGTPNLSQIITIQPWDHPEVPMSAYFLNLVTKMIPKDLQMNQTWSSGDSKMKWNQQNPIIKYVTKRLILVNIYQCVTFLQTVFSIPANLPNLQINNQLVATGADGKGEALG